MSGLSGATTPPAWEHGWAEYGRLLTPTRYLSFRKRVSSKLLFLVVSATLLSGEDSPQHLSSSDVAAGRAAFGIISRLERMPRGDPAASCHEELDVQVGAISDYPLKVALCHYLA